MGNGSLRFTLLGRESGGCEVAPSLVLINEASLHVLLFASHPLLGPTGEAAGTLPTH